MAKQKIETEEARKAREVTEAVARNIETLAKGVREVLDGRLNKRAIVLLIASASLGMRNKEDVEKVLDAIAKLDKTFLK